LETGNENDSPRGRIYIMRAVQSGRMPLDNAAVRHIDLCLGCRACEVACPSGVQYGELLECTRERIEQRHRRPFFQRLLRRVAVEKVFPFPNRMRLALWPALLLKKAGVNGFRRLAPKFLRDAISLLPDHVEPDRTPEFSRAATELKRGRVGFIRGCVMSVMFGRTNAASVRLLNRAGYDVVTPASQGCCGALYAHSGSLSSARECARRNIEAFEALNLDAVIINAAGCGSTLKEYGHLLSSDHSWADRAREFSAKVKDLTEWLVESRFVPAANPSERNVDTREAVPQSSTQPVVTYHDACHLAHPQRITAQPRKLVRAVAGANFVELPESDVCCGSAGSYNLTEPQMAERLQKRKIDNIIKTGAKIVVTTNPGCILQIRAGLTKAGAHDVEVVHIADFLASRL
jgi:glycolate oxidase iron-sulfur subunit